MTAYSVVPFTRELDGAFLARGEIECWRGSVEDIRDTVARAVEALETEKDNAVIRTALTLSTGKQHAFSSLDDFYRAVSEAEPSSLTTMRVEVNVSKGSGEADESSAVLVIRREIPAVLMEVSGKNRALVQGIADLMYWRLYSGYVDRLGSWRSLAAMLLATVAVVPAVLAVNSLSNLTAVWRTVAIVALIPLVVLLGLLLLAVGFSIFTVKKPLELIDPENQGKPSRFRSVASRAVRSKWTRRTLWVVVTIALGTLSSKLADLIPFP